ncbi:translational activator GCN1 [Elysia marginata]|uniref:Translational activator GCN1 n=1 Tax=Elysia marginata TaxID=1093978 RepID=A0AAV4JV03_9GAST|nr:translational activator GCN1 [Elysia marginata]
MALSVALKVTPQRVWTDSMQKSVSGTISKLVAADRIPICVSGLRAAGHLLKYLLDNELSPATVTELETLLVKVTSTITWCDVEKMKN